MVLPTGYVLTLLLAAARLSALLATAPVFGGQTMPAPLRVMIALALALALFPPGKGMDALPASDTVAFGLLLVRELALGALAGFAVNLVFHAVQMAGSLVGLQLGFGLAGVFDPSMQRLSSPLEQLYNLLATLLFLGLDLHHHLLLGMARLFATLPPGAWTMPPELFAGGVGVFAGVLTAAVEIALPLIGVLVLTDLMLGVIGRFVPQMNLLLVGLPVKAAAGLLVLGLALPFLLVRMGDLLKSAPGSLRLLFP